MSMCPAITSQTFPAMTESKEQQPPGGPSGPAPPPTPVGGSNILDGPLLALIERTGYPLVQENGQRRYGPPPGCSEGASLPRGCEVFVGKIPRDCFEDELVPVFERVGKLYEVCVGL